MPRSLAPQTPEEVLARLQEVRIEGPESPKTPAETREAQKKLAALLKQRSALTIRFIDFKIKKKAADAEDDEMYLTLCQARIESLELGRTASKVQRNGLKNFKREVGKMKEQYDSLVSSIKHLTLLEPEKEVTAAL